MLLIGDVFFAQHIPEIVRIALWRAACHTDAIPPRNIRIRETIGGFGMKTVKSLLLLGSAAGLVAVSAGQAADLPVKAKPVEYVKVCSLYGAGFYYMPGTDICL